MSERLQLKGLLSEARRKAREKQAEIEGLVILLRNILNPYESDVAKLNVDSAHANMTRLHALVHEMRDLKAKIATYEQDLE